MTTTVDRNIIDTAINAVAGDADDLSILDDFQNHTSKPHLEHLRHCFGVTGPCHRILMFIGHLASLYESKALPKRGQEALELLLYSMSIDYDTNATTMTAYFPGIVTSPCFCDICIKREVGS